MLAVVTPVVGALAGATVVFDWFSGKVDPPPPAEIDARVLSVSLRSRNDRLVDYLRETNQSTADLSEYEGGERGFVFRVRTRIKGDEGTRLPLRWAMIDAGTGGPLRDPIYSQTAVVFQPRGPNQARTWLIWTPKPPRRGTFRLRATLIDKRSQPLDEAESRHFSLKRTPHA